VGWALPWLLFQIFPAADLVTTPRPLLVRIVAGVALVVFTVAYLHVFGRAFSRGCAPAYRALAVVAVLGVALTVTMGTAWAGLMIYLSAAVAVTLPERWIWPAVLGATGVSAGVAAANDLLDDMFILPVMCVLTAFALRGTRYLISVNAELVEARDELARSAVAEERLRFARDLHDLLGHSLSVISLKAQLARRRLPDDPEAAEAEVADIETVSRDALREVREAVSGYRKPALDAELQGARTALDAAGIETTIDRPAVELPAEVEAVLAWTVREAATNVIRHSGARHSTIRLVPALDQASVEIVDDGRGVNGSDGGGTGLMGLQERLRQAGGRLEAGPREDGPGFRVRAIVPVASAG
jgi:two-component system sensor histidine kinase DesK